jgi:hypothetical protein
VKHAWKEKQIDIQLIDSKENPADTLTKALPKVDFETLLYESFLRIATALSLSVQIGIGIGVGFVSSSKRTDSDNAVAILKKDSYNKGTKWLDIKYQFVKHAWNWNRSWLRVIQ